MDRRCKHLGVVPCRCLTLPYSRLERYLVETNPIEYDIFGRMDLQFAGEYEYVLDYFSISEIRGMRHSSSRERIVSIYL
jgi:hypothetical protein